MLPKAQLISALTSLPAQPPGPASGEGMTAPHSAFAGSHGSPLPTVARGSREFSPSHGCGPGMPNHKRTGAKPGAVALGWEGPHSGHRPPVLGLPPDSPPSTCRHPGRQCLLGTGSRVGAAWSGRERLPAELCGPLKLPASAPPTGAVLPNTHLPIPPPQPCPFLKDLRPLPAPP